MLFLLGAFGTLGNIDNASGGDDSTTPETTPTDSGGVETSEGSNK